MPALRLKVLGGLSIESDSPIGPAANQRGRLVVLAAIDAAGDRGITRDLLLSWFWPEARPERARQALSQTLHVLRKDLRSQDLFLGTATLRLNREVVASDRGEFLAAVGDKDDRRAVNGYGGSFLEGFYSGESAELDQWVDSQRRDLQRLYEEALRRIAQQSADAEDWTTAAPAARQLLALNNLDGLAIDIVCRAWLAASEYANAYRELLAFEKRLHEEVGTPLPSRLRKLKDRIVEGTPAPFRPSTS